MTIDRSEEIQVLYEIATVVGDGTALEPMLSNSLSIILRKLNCSAGSIHLIREEQADSFFFQIQKSIPRNHKKNSGLKRAVGQLPDVLDSKALSVWWKTMPSSGRDEENNYYHILPLFPQGVLTMIRNSSPISDELLKSLRPITKKLTSAICACIAKERLKTTLKKFKQGQIELQKYQNHLETMVEDRTDELVKVNCKLKKEIEERKQAQTELLEEKLKLQKAFQEIKQLSGLLPICSSCKNVRDDKGYWNQIETYISEHSDAVFSHSICPKCAKKLYPDIFDDDTE